MKMPAVSTSWSRLLLAEIFANVNNFSWVDHQPLATLNCDEWAFFLFIPVHTNWFPWSWIQAVPQVVVGMNKQVHEYILMSPANVFSFRIIACKLSVWKCPYFINYSKWILKGFQKPIGYIRPLTKCYWCFLLYVLLKYRFYYTWL